MSDDTPAYAAGTFTVDLQLDPDKVARGDGRDAEGDLKSMKTHPVAADRLKRAKTQMRVDARPREAETVRGHLDHCWPTTT